MPPESSTEAPAGGGIQLTLHPRYPWPITRAISPPQAHLHKPRDAQSPKAGGKPYQAPEVGAPCLDCPRRASAPVSQHGTNHDAGVAFGLRGIAAWGHGTHCGIQVHLPQRRDHREVPTSSWGGLVYPGASNWGDWDPWAATGQTEGVSPAVERIHFVPSLYLFSLMRSIWYHLSLFFLTTRPPL